MTAIMAPPRIFLPCAVLLAALALRALADDGRLLLTRADTNLNAQVRGSEDDDWRIEVSTNLVQWTNVVAVGTLLSGGTGAPVRVIGSHGGTPCFHRARKTDGLYDITVLRTIRLQFSQPNWYALLASGRISGSNTIGSLTMDNGLAIPCIGARHKGNTSYTGLPPAGAPTKKSINIEVDYTNASARVMGFKTLNLNNAYTDEVIMREPLYFNVMRLYTVCPKASFAKLYITGEYWGVYSFAQQENNQLIKEYFPSDNGDRWKAPNAPGGGGFSGSGSALSYLGPNWYTYTNRYELKTQNSSNPWAYLVQTVTVLNNTPTNQLRDAVENVMAVDRWLWFLAIENIFTDEDSYYFKGADYAFYYEPESGRIHPVEHDGNESFVNADSSLSPVYGATLTNRPVLHKFLNIPELRQRYLAHMRTVLQESFNASNLFPLINQHSALCLAAITEDTKKGYTMATYSNDLTALRTFITARHTFLTNHVELRPLPPLILAVAGPTSTPTAADAPFITATVAANGANGIDSVWLYHRGASYGRFTAARMFDDGAHGDGAAGDSVFGAATSNYLAGVKVRYYVEARSATSAKAACFAPPRAEQETYSYRIGMLSATNAAVVINEFMADNATTIADPQGDYDDWIELRNITDQAVDLGGCYLSDNPDNPRKWQFPAGTTIPADGYLLVWADEDGIATPGLHANFKLSKSGESVLLVDADAHMNMLLDTVTYGAQSTDVSYGRTAADPDVWGFMVPTPAAQNQ